MLDHVFRTYCEKNINLYVPWYLMAAHAYYVDDDPILLDSTFDEMAKFMLDNWDDINHFHKHLLGPMDLVAGTYLGTYPERVKGGLKALREKYAINKKKRRKR